MKVADMKTKSSNDLLKHADKLRKTLAETRTNRYTAEQKNVKQIGALRKELAQALTFSRKAELNEHSKQPTVKTKKAEEK